MTNTEVKKLLLSVTEYRRKYQDILTEGKILSYFDRNTTDLQPGQTVSMIKFLNGYDVPGGEWPENYGRFCITDFTQYKSYKGRKRVYLSPTEYNYEDSPDMLELVSYPLKTTAQLIEEERKRLQHSLYSLPNRLRNVYKEKLIVTIDGQNAQASTLTTELLDEIISQMSPMEYATYLKLINCVDIELYPSVELPITIRIDGIDDGAIEVQFSNMTEVTSFIERLSNFRAGVHKQLLQGTFGFKTTD